MRRIAVFGALIVAALALWLSVDWALWQRWLNRPQNIGEWPASFYQPTAPVMGSNRPFFPAAAPDELTLSTAALEAAATYAEEHNSAALLVLHRGRLQLERYWQGIGADSLFSGRAMTRSMLGPLTGIALAEGALSSLDEPTANYLSEWSGDSPRRDHLAAAAVECERAGKSAAGCHRALQQEHPHHDEL